MTSGRSCRSSMPMSLAISEPFSAISSLMHTWRLHTVTDDQISVGRQGEVVIYKLILGLEPLLNEEKKRNEDEVDDRKQ
ncbi:hypothetical protein FQN60_017083 [Etheostoma spectabile]|uniref:Uncharacterized protein n=1 Tax=Etheostoma spectabile TaxID=54343 RepID=A0A5J5DEG8_9PERO|nr:hypothetical protein FQN60_017083 [Etheostoma spectabile]